MLPANALLTDTSGSPLVLQLKEEIKTTAKVEVNCSVPRPEHRHVDISSIESSWGKCVSFKQLEFLLWQIRFTF